jgi:LysR family cyn operon transcriptional activator
MVPNVFMESAAPETLLALAREGHGAGIVPSTAQIDRRSLRVSPLIFRGNQLTVDITLLWSGTRRLPRYAEAFSAMLAAHMRAVIPEFGAGDGGRRSIRRQKKMAR